MEAGIRRAAPVDMSNIVTAEHCAAAGGRSLFIAEAAALLGVSKRTIYYRIREGRLVTVRTPCGSQRVLLASIEALLRDEGQADRRRTPVAARDQVTMP
jgi:excisionase family DNA binding protein